jgi:hypothetical protein
MRIPNAGSLSSGIFFVLMIPDSKNEDESGLLQISGFDVCPLDKEKIFSARA